MSETIYCGNAKIVSTNFGDLTKISMSKDDIKKIQKYMMDEGKEWVNIAIKEKKEKKEGKPTHYLEIDQWKPKESTENYPDW